MEGMWETVILAGSGSITNVMTKQSVTWQADMATGFECCKTWSAYAGWLILPNSKSFQVLVKKL
jgi:hypothetical protein